MKSRYLSAGMLVLGMGCWLGSEEANAFTADLTAKGNTATIEGAIFTELTTEIVAGTGLIDPFLRIQRGSEARPLEGIETGYNTDGTLEFETKPGIWTHSLQVKDAPLVTVGGIEYREFVLDINEPGGSKSLVTLDQLQIFEAASNTLTGYDTTTRSLPGSTLVYDLDATTDNEILLDYDLFAGSGRLDMIALIPNSVFSSEELFLYMFNSFGETIKASDGFEEWAVKLDGSFTPPDPPSLVPEPASSLLFFIGLIGLGFLSRHRYFAKPLG